MRLVRWLMGALGLWILVGCGRVSYQPPVVPLKVSVGAEGVSVGIEPSFTTAIGTFAWEAEVPVMSFVQNHKRSDWQVERVLVVRIDNKLYVYELKPNVHFDFDSNIDERYYKRVSFYYNPSDPQGDIILELETISAAGIVATYVAQETIESSNESFQKTTPTFTVSPCQNSPKRLSVSHQAIVCTYRSGEPVFLREQPSKYSSYIKRLAPGAVVSVIKEAVCDDASGWWYWKVRTLHGYTGWMAEGGDSKDPYFLCPYP